jgi:hypothetical protein
MMIIRDGRKLYHLAKKFGFTYDKTYKYVTNYTDEIESEMKKYGYILKYVSGCFHPYVYKKI